MTMVQFPLAGFGDLSIDIDALRVTHVGHPVARLTPAEMRLLLRLANAYPNTVSRDDHLVGGDARYTLVEHEGKERNDARYDRPGGPARRD